MATYGIGTYGSGTYGLSDETPVSGEFGTYGSGFYGDDVYGGSEAPTPPPFTPPPDVIIPQSGFATPPPIWRFILADTETMTNINELFSKNVTLNLALNKPGSISFSVPLDADNVEDIEPITTCIKAYRRGILIWSGPVWTIEEDLPQNSLAITCTGWFEQLNHRYLRNEVNYTGVAGGAIALDLLAKANLQAWGAITPSNLEGIGVVTPTWLLPGTNDDNQARTMHYDKWQNIGQAITQLSEVENGYDFEVTPDTRTLNTYSNAVGSGLHRDKPDIQFGYNWGPDNLRNCKRNIDSSTLLTNFHVFGTLGQGVTASADAPYGSPSPLEVYGLWEEQASIQAQDPNILARYAVGEIAIRAFPKVLYTITPFPYTGSNKIPQPFVDYKVGDIIRFSAVHAPRVSIKGQAARVYGMTVNVDENNNETISDLQVAP